MLTGGRAPAAAWPRSAECLVRPVLDAVFRLQNGEDDEEVTMQPLEPLVEGFAAAAGLAGWSARDVNDAAFALVALLDETVLTHVPRLREQWLLQPLQRRYFEESAAGVRFFERLDMLVSEPARVEVLKVYYLCLCSGFFGKYAVGGAREELELVRRRLRDVLVHAGAFQPTVVPNALGRPSIRVRPTRSLPIAVLAGVFAVGAVVFGGVLRAAETAQTDAAVARFESLVGEHAR